MRSILLATDLEAGTDRALERALLLATTLKAKLHVLHVCPIYNLWRGKEAITSLKPQAEETLITYLAACDIHKDLKIDVDVVEGGEIFIEIIQRAENVKADLIVMGVHGKTELRDMFIGTTVERVIRKGVKPVLMVKDKPLGDYSNILIGTDFSAGSKHTFRVAVELAPNGIFYLVHSYDLPDKFLGYKIKKYEVDVVKKAAKEKMRKFIKCNNKLLKKFGVVPENFHNLLVRDEPFHCLMHEASLIKSDLLAIGSHGRGPLISNILGGTAHDILSNAPCDVLVASGYDN